MGPYQRSRKWRRRRYSSQKWKAARAERWLAKEMGLPDVAAAAAGEVDGSTAIEMDKDDWKELGASGIKAAKIVGQLKKLQ